MRQEIPIRKRQLALRTRECGQLPRNIVALKVARRIWLPRSQGRGMPRLETIAGADIELPSMEGTSNAAARERAVGK